VDRTSHLGSGLKLIDTEVAPGRGNFGSETCSKRNCSDIRHLVVLVVYKLIRKFLQKQSNSVCGLVVKSIVAIFQRSPSMGPGFDSRRTHENCLFGISFLFWEVIHTQAQSLFKIRTHIAGFAFSSSLKRDINLLCSLGHSKLHILLRVCLTPIFLSDKGKSLWCLIRTWLLS
jgi:hypothetical protein